jgi:hypothetical protein
MAIDLWVAPQEVAPEGVEREIVLKVTGSVHIDKVPILTVVVRGRSVMPKGDIGCRGKRQLDYHPEGLSRDVDRKVGPVHTGSLLFERRVGIDRSLLCLI